MTTDDALRAWARGTYATEAAVELLIRSFDGRFARPGLPWIARGPGERVWLDAERLRAGLGPLSSGERRVLTVVVAFIEPDTPIDLSDAVCVDREHLDLILAALAHAGGSHEHTTVAPGASSSPVRLVRPGALHAWPPGRDTTVATRDDFVARHPEREPPGL